MSISVSTPRILDGEYIDDGYSFIEKVSALGLKAIAGWGQDGWDLLEWPYYVCAAGKRGDKWVRLTYCEGDFALKEWDTKAELYADIDQLAAWHWRQHSEPWITGYAEGEEPRWLKGPYRKPDTCEVCGEEVTYSENERLRADIDFVEHGEPAHLIRVVTKEYLDA